MGRIVSGVRVSASFSVQIISRLVSLLGSEGFQVFSFLCIFVPWSEKSTERTYDRACLDQLLNRDQIAGKAVRSCAICRRRDRDRFKFHSQHLTSFTRHCAKTDHAESCGGALQLYRISRGVIRLSVN